MFIEWYGHSCFKIISNDSSIVLDPYKPNMITGLGDYKIVADAVYCSHEHGDHNYKAAVEISGRKHNFDITIIDTFHDAEAGTKRGKNKITIIKSENLKIAHLGDLGCDLTEQQVKMLKNLDTLMIPIGGYYTINASQAKKICDILLPKVIIPMHYGGENFGPSVIAPLSEFTDLFSKTLLKVYESNVLVLNCDTIKQVTILKYK